jgi:hypothetical protein
MEKPTDTKTLEKPNMAALVRALIKAQREMAPALKTAYNPGYKSKYVDLAGAWEACGNALTSNGLTVVQTTRVRDDGMPLLVSALYHESGANIAGEYPLLPATQNDPQKLGGALTYARRYALMALVGLAPEDDDGTTASAKPAAPAPAAPPAQPKPEAVSPAEVKALAIAMTAHGMTEQGPAIEWVNKCLKPLGRSVTSRKDLTPVECRLLMGILADMSTTGAA